MAYPRKPDGISINELSSHLRLSRNYITRNITHCVKHVEKFPSKGAVVKYDESELRDYLTHLCTFSRQTRRIDLEKELRIYSKLHPNDDSLKNKNFRKKFIGKSPDWRVIKRSELPFIPLKTTDFWDFPLIFPQEYTQGNDSPEAKRKTAEICYRDMFKIGAIKIQLGRQKTMFYIPQDEGVILPPLNQLSDLSDYDENCFLVPADWTPFYKGHQSPASHNNSVRRLQISITADSNEFNQALIEQSLRKGFALNHIISHEIDPERNLTIVTFQASTLEESDTTSPVKDARK